MVRSLGPAVLVALALTACKDTPTSVLLTIEAATGLPTPDELRLDVFGPAGPVIEDHRLPRSGPPALPDDVVLFPRESSGLIRIRVRALAAGTRVGEGVSPVTLKTGAQVKATVTVSAGALPDRDGDGIPDDIDSCPDLPNPEQGPCAADGGLDMGDAAPDLVIVPDLSCDQDDDTYLALVCGGLDCDDTDPKVHPGKPEGPPGSSACSDSADNDCDGKVDLDDTGCKSCASDGECEDNNVCTGDECRGGKCANTPTGEGQTCDDGNACTKGETCKLGLCSGGAGVSCTAVDPCLQPSCDPAKGCVTQPRPDGQSCDDGEYCTVGDACKGGACQGSARDCDATAPACKLGSCNETQDTCVFTSVSDGTSCDDKDACTQGETCSAGQCVAPKLLTETVIAQTNLSRRSDRALAMDSKGKLHTVTYGYSDHKLVYATNASGSWSVETVDASSADVGAWAAVAVGPMDVVYIVYTDVVGLKTRLAWRVAGIGSWTKQGISDGDGHNSIAVGAGKLHISFQQNGKLYYMTGFAPGNLTKTLVDEVTGGDDVGYHSSIAVDGQGVAHIAHGRGTTTAGPSATPWDQVKSLRHSSNAGGSWATTTPASVTTDHGGFASIAVAGTEVHVAHTDTTNYSWTSGKLYLTRLKAGSWSTQVVGGGANNGTFSSILLDSQGNSHIAYRDPSTNSMVHATDAGGTWVLTVIESLGAPGNGWAGLVQATSGTIHATYEVGNNSLRHAAFSACP